jgi:outer membrane protein OmpA-like peptidoglycan-associated protein
MAEQAQRRAPETQSQENSSNDNHAFEELRHLIVAPEQEKLAEIRDRIENTDRRTEDVSNVVAEAIQMRREQGDDHALAEALGPTIEATLRESVREHPHVIADALFPVMGPAIRKSITETLRSMLESFNEALEHSLSWRGIQWRIESLRTDKPFAEIVMMHSLLYQVEEVFLIHRETGLLLNHLTAPSVKQKEARMLTGMLTALQQLSQDRFQTEEGESLTRWEMPDLEGWLEVGPNAVIAVVIRGHAPADYRVRMNEALEEIHQKFGAALERFEGDAGPFRATDGLLSPLLERKAREDSEGGVALTRRKPRAVLALAGIAGLGLVLWGGYVSYRIIQWSSFEQKLRQQPGIVVTSVVRSGLHYHVRGFRDPLAPDPRRLLAEAGLESRVDVELAPFYSTEDAVVARRAKVLLAAPTSVKISMKGGVLRAEGVASPQWIARLKDRGMWIAGVNEIDTTGLQDAEVIALNRDKAAVEKLVLLFPLGRAELEADQQEDFEKARQGIAGLLAQAGRANEKVQIEVLGHTDSTGVEASNLSLSRQRADQILRALERAGVKSTAFRPIGVGTSQPLRNEDTEEGRRLNRSVTFRVETSAAPSATAEAH